MAEKLGRDEFIPNPASILIADDAGMTLEIFPVGIFFTDFSVND